MGGYDIFKSDWQPAEQSWTKPENIGYPLNNSSDNMSISFSQSGRHAYVSMFLEGGIGDLDIYRVTFDNIEPTYTVINAEILQSDSSRIYNTGNVFAKVLENGSNKMIGRYLPNKKTGRFTIILPPGNFKLEVNAEGFLPYEEEIIIPDRDFHTRILNKNIILKKQ